MSQTQWDLRNIRDTEVGQGPRVAKAVYCDKIESI